MNRDEKAPLFSIVMPVFNGAKLIKETILSLQAQTLGDFELLVMDDGSTDNTAEIVQQLAATDPRIKLHRLINGGAPSARNKGLQLAKGQYLAVNDADDLWPSDRLANQYTVLQEDDSRIVIGGVQRFSVNTANEKIWGYTTLLAANPLQGRDYVKFVLAQPANHMAIFHTLCGKRSLIEKYGGWDETLASAEDWDFWLRLAKSVPFYHIDKVMLYYRKYPDSVTKKAAKTKPLECQLTIVRKIAGLLPLSFWERRHFASYRFKEAIKIYNYEGEFLLSLKTLCSAFLYSDLALQKSYYGLCLDTIKGTARSFIGKNRAL
jgi:glycosyltransferase involved in cell wall biosynthesis